MGETTDQIAHHIEMKRQELQSNFTELAQAESGDGLAAAVPEPHPGRACGRLRYWHAAGCDSGEKQWGRCTARLGAACATQAA